MSLTSTDWIKKLDLQKHPEGGYFKEIYRSNEIISKNCLPERFAGDRPFSTSIYFMLTGTDISAFHRLKADEGWFFHAGNSALTLYEIQKNGDLKTHFLGQNTNKGEQLQVFIQAKSWFCAEVHDKSKEAFVLVGCMMSPAFDFEDFELAEAKKLAQEFPKHTNLIQRFSIR